MRQAQSTATQWSWWDDLRGRRKTGRVSSKALLSHSEVGHGCRFAPMASLGLIGRLEGRFGARLLRAICRFGTVPADLEHEPP